MRHKDPRTREWVDDGPRDNCFDCANSHYNELLVDDDEALTAKSGGLFASLRGLKPGGYHRIEIHSDSE